LSEHGSNPYAYTGDDPINFTDPSGAMKCRSIFKSWVCKALRKFAQTHATISWCEGFCVGLVLHPGGHVSLAGSPCCGYGRLSAIFTANKPTNGLAAQSCLYVCLGESAPPKWGNLAVGLGTPGGSFGPWYYLDLW
jgi:hypothetical protein